MTFVSLDIGMGPGPHPLLLLKLYPPPTNTHRVFSYFLVFKISCFLLITLESRDWKNSPKFKTMVVSAEKAGDTTEVGDLKGVLLDLRKVYFSNKCLEQISKNSNTS